MPEQIRALIVVLVLGSLVWWLARPAMVQVVPSATFTNWRRGWYVVTLAWFLSPNFWVYAGVLTVMVNVAGRREPHVFGLYMLLLLAAPPVTTAIPGFGLVNYLFTLDHYRLLALALLLPWAWRLSRDGSSARYFQSPLDGLVLAYLLLHSVLAFRGGNFTSDARTALMLWIDLFLPYYVASRSIRSSEGFRDALAGLVVGAALLSVFAVFEVLRSWKLYEAASVAMGLDGFGAYKTRGGFIRPAVTIIDSIALGYVIVAGLAAYLYLQGLVSGRWRRWLGWLVLVAGVLGSLSRGPWVGAVLVVLVFMLTGPHPVRRLMQGAAAGVTGFFVLSLLPAGQKLISLLPFVGQEEQGNVEYRANLLTASMPVIERNLLFGSSDYVNAPELQVLRQGEGIVDVVNSYVGVALHAGGVGLMLFVGMFVSAMLLLTRGRRWARQQGDADGQQLGRALLAALLGIMFIIFTMSSILIVPTIYFAFFGLSCAFCIWQQGRDRVPPARVDV